MNNLAGTESNNLHINGFPLLSAYDFRASSFYDGYMSMSVMADRISKDIIFEEKLKTLYEEKLKKKGKLNNDRN